MIFAAATTNFPAVIAVAVAVAVVVAIAPRPHTTISTRPTLDVGALMNEVVDGTSTFAVAVAGAFATAAINLIIKMFSKQNCYS